MNSLKNISLLITEKYLTGRIIKMVALSAITFSLIACGGDDDNSTKSSHTSVYDIAAETESFSTLVSAINATNLDAVLDDENQSFTVFAPTNAAFDALGQETINALLADTDTLSDILLYHVISGSEIGSAEAVSAAGSKIEMANEKMLALSLSGDTLFANLSTVVTYDIMADNGVIHVIDSVLMPPVDTGTPSNNIVETAIANGNFTTLVTALQAADLVSVLENENEVFTVFAPSDAAFEKIPSETLNALLADQDALRTVLLQHVISGSAVDSITAFSLNGEEANTAASNSLSIDILEGELLIEGSLVTISDIHTSNGIIHVIDTVITEVSP